MALTPYMPELVPDPRDHRIRELETEVREMRQQVRAAEAETERVRRQNGRAIAQLRQVLSPVYQGLQQVFGEMDAVAPNGAGDGLGVPDRARAVWESWKSKLPGKRAEFIQALLDHGEMTGAQLRVATHTAAGSVAGIIHELKKLGLINKNGGKYSLKEL